MTEKTLVIGWDVLPDVRSAHGAPMGRMSTDTTEGRPVRLRLSRLNFVDGDYDEGGAYWGCPANVWWARDREGKFTEFVRADNRREAARIIFSENENARFIQRIDGIGLDGLKFYLNKGRGEYTALAKDMILMDSDGQKLYPACVMHRNGNIRIERMERAEIKQLGRKTDFDSAPEPFKQAVILWRSK